MSSVLHKFGGSSVANAECFRRVASIVLEVDKQHDKVAVVVSAMGGKPKVTDLLISTVGLALAGNLEEVRRVLDSLRTRHFDVIHDLLPESSWAALETKINEDLDDISHILRATAIMKVAGSRVTGIVSGHGELWSAQILAAFLSQTTGRPYHFLDARKALVVLEDDTGPEVLWEESRTNLAAVMQSNEGDAWTHMVITGFIASTKEGVMTTLTRDGSDFTASIFGNLLNTDAVTIWTDVSGVLRSDSPCPYPLPPYPDPNLLTLVQIPAS
jgi:aspartokinase/homoserine dehydrogenase 1